MILSSRGQHFSVQLQTVRSPHFQMKVYNSICLDRAVRMELIHNSASLVVLIGLILSTTDIFFKLRDEKLKITFSGSFVAFEQRNPRLCNFYSCRTLVLFRTLSLWARKQLEILTLWRISDLRGESFFMTAASLLFLFITSWRKSLNWHILYTLEFLNLWFATLNFTNVGMSWCLIQLLRKSKSSDTFLYLKSTLSNLPIRRRTGRP